MKILLVVAYFVPEIGSAAHIYFDLARAFARRGHSVDIITSYPREFNLDKKDQGKKFPLAEEIESVTVYRCKHPANRDNLFVRGWSTSTWFTITSRTTARTARSTMSAYSTYRHSPCTTLQRRSSSMTEPPLSSIFRISILRNSPMSGY